MGSSETRSRARHYIIPALISIHTRSRSLVMSINKNLYGKWELAEADSANFDAYMKKCGVGMVTRIAAKAMKQTLGIVDDAAPGKIHLTTTSSLKSSDDTFLLDEEQDETTLDGRKCRTTFKITAEGNIHEVQKFKGMEATLDWISTGADSFDLVLQCDGVKCVRSHKRVE